MAMVSANYLKLLSEGLRKVFFLQYQQKESTYPQLFDVQKSNKRQELDYSMVGLTMMGTKAEGVAMDYEDFITGYQTTYTHTSYGKAIRLTRELMDDDLYSVMSKRAKALARSAWYRKEYDHAAVFNNSSSALSGYSAGAAFTGGDGVGLISASHPRADGLGNLSNTAGAVDLTLANLQTGITNFRKMKDDNGELIAMTAGTLLVPPDLDITAHELLNSIGKPGTANNETNVIRNKLNIVVWDFLTDVDAWFILADKSDGAPMSWNRVDLEFDRDGDFSTKDLLMSAYMRYSTGFSDWRWVYAGTG